jgi:hypothetical protein
MTNNETALENQAINPGAESIAQSLGNARQNGDWFNCTCPCCADDGAHLGIRDTDDDKILVNCFHDCPKKAILAALAARGLYIPARRGKLTGTLVSPIPPGALPKPMAFDAFRVSAPEGFTAKKLWWYCNEQGEYLFGIVRFEQPRNLFLPIEERPPKPEKTFRPLTAMAERIRGAEMASQGRAETLAAVESPLARKRPFRWRHRLRRREGRERRSAYLPATHLCLTGARREGPGEYRLVTPMRAGRDDLAGQ